MAGIVLRLMELSLHLGATVYECQYVEHAGMTSTRGTTHEDRWPSPGASYLPYKTEISNMDS